MLFVAMPDADWAGAELEIDHSLGGGAETWAFDTDYTGDTPASAHDVSVDLSAWLNDAGRAWNGSATFSRTYSVNAEPPYIQVWHTTSAGTFDVTPNATAESMLGITTETGASVMGDESGDWCAGSLGTEIYIRRWLRVPQSPGAGGIVGGYMMAHIVTSSRVPIVEAVLDADEVVRLNDILGDAASPRWAHLYDESASTWRRVALGRAAPQRRSPTQWSWAPEVMGGG